jgi:hypothetical protein
MARYTKTGTPSTIGEVNAQFDLIATAIDDTLSRVGDAPNQLETTLDANSRRIINLPLPLSPQEPLRLQDLSLVAAPFSEASIVDSILVMKATNYVIGNYVICERYYSDGDLVEGLNFIIVAGGTGTDNGGSFHNLNNGTQAQLINTSTIINVKQFGARGNGAVNEASAIQAAITYVATTGTGRGTITFTPETYLITTTIIVPSHIILNLNKARLDGNVVSTFIAYNSAGFHMFESGYMSSGVPVSNRGTALNAFRVVNLVIKGGEILNCNSAIFLTNCNEGCFIDDIDYQNISKATTMVSCFYMKMGRSLARGCAQAAAGQILHHITGGDNNLIEFNAVTAGGSATGFQIDGIRNFSLAFNNCSFEEGATTISSAGIRIGSGAFLSGLSIDNAYVEGVKYGLILDSGAAVYGGSLTNSIFNNNEYAVLSVENGLRLFSITNNALPDDGGIDRNLVDISAVGNDVIIHRPSVSNLSALLSNVILGDQSKELAETTFKVGTNLNARSNAFGESKNNIVKLPFQGRSAVSVTNEIPYSALTRDGDNAKISTYLFHDVSNVLTFNFSGNSTNISWDVKGFIFNDTVSYVTQSPAGITVALETSSGTPVVGEAVVLRIAKDAAGFGAVLNATGIVRHV